MIWLLVACNPSPPTALPQGEPPPLPAESAWKAVRPLDGVQRLFGGPFRCRLADDTVVDFFPNGMARGEPAFRGRWTHQDQTLTVDARHHGVDLVYRWPYQAYTHEGDWVLASADEAIACRPGHQVAPGPAGRWVEVVDGGGPAADAARVLSTAPEVVFAVDGAVGPAREGVWLQHRPGVEALPLAQHVATGLGVPVTVREDAALASPYRLVVGSVSQGRR